MCVFPLHHVCCVCVCVHAVPPESVCGCRVRAQGQNMFFCRTEPSLQHPQCSGGILHLFARQRLANEVSLCCHVSIPVIPAGAESQGRAS